MDELIAMIAQRDNISLEEARSAVEDCQDEIDFIMEHDGTLEEIEDIVADYLGLEPDYVPMIMGMW